MSALAQLDDIIIELHFTDTRPEKSNVKPKKTEYHIIAELEWEEKAYVRIAEDAFDRNISHVKPYPPMAYLIYRPSKLMEIIHKLAS